MNKNNSKKKWNIENIYAKELVPVDHNYFNFKGTVEELPDNLENDAIYYNLKDDRLYIKKDENTLYKILPENDLIDMNPVNKKVAEKTNKEKIDQILAIVKQLTSYSAQDKCISDILNEKYLVEIKNINSKIDIINSRICDIEAAIEAKILQADTIDHVNIYNLIRELVNKESENFENIFTGIDAIKNLIVDQEKSINDKIENCHDNSIDYIAEKYNSLFTGVSRLLTNAVDTKEKIDEILKDDSKKDEAVCEDNSYKLFCENLEKIYNRKIDFSIYSQDTINWIMECKDDSSKDLDLLKSIVRCHIGSIREIYIDGEPYKFIKINEESKVSFTQGVGVPFTDIFHDYACIDFPKLLQFGSSYDYKTSNVRKWINNEFIQMIEPGVVKYMEIQEVESGGEILMDYVKIPSCTEIGYMNSDIKEGTCYNALNPMILNRDGYWLRTGFSLDNVYSINNDNSAVIYTNNQSVLHIVPIIRIKESRIPYET